MANKKEKLIFHFTTEVRDVEIRKVTDVDASFTDKNGKAVESHYILIKGDAGENEDTVYLRDKNMANLQKYKRGMVGTFFLRLDAEDDFSPMAKFFVIDFKENE